MLCSVGGTTLHNPSPRLDWKHTNLFYYLCVSRSKYALILIFGVPLEVAALCHPPHNIQLKISTFYHQLVVCNPLDYTQIPKLKISHANGAAKAKC